MKFKKMYKNMPKILKRTMWAKILGFIVSLVGFITIAATGYYTGNEMLAWGILLWYPMVGAMIGLAGVMDEHPLLGKMGIWRGVLIGGFMNLIMVLFAGETLLNLAASEGYDFSYSFIMIGAMFEGAIIGGIIDGIVTDKFGEGKKLMKK